MRLHLATTIDIQSTSRWCFCAPIYEKGLDSAITASKKLERRFIAKSHAAAPYINARPLPGAMGAACVQVTTIHHIVFLQRSSIKVGMNITYRYVDLKVLIPIFSQPYE
jgi:hypothetical protein